MMMGSLSRWINGTSASFHCPEVGSYITNLTSSYTEKSNEASMVSASVIMFMLAGLFFNLNLFSGISDVSAILDPKVRLFLTSALSLFLPVMSYLFSEAKNAAAGHSGSPVAAKVDLPLRAGMILVWMLLVELLRKKVDEIRMRGYSGTIQRAGRVAWLGSLVFFNIRSAGRKAVFSILWILCATKVLQRITFTEVGKRSYAHGKNARLISSYMSSHILGQEEPTSDEPPAGGNELLRNCDYIVMGEDDMEGIIEPTADGYKLQEDDGKTTTATSDDDDDSIKKLKEKQHIVVTVGEVWKLIDDDRNFPASPKQAESLRRMCLSFALFKLLRRRFEHLPAMTDKEVRDSRNLILNGLYKHTGGETYYSPAEAVFQVMNDEINFLCEYYHSVIPVVLASPFFLLVNYVLVNIAVAFLCLMAVILCGNGDIRYALHSLSADNYTLQAGVFRLAVCLVLRSTRQPAAFFSLVDLAITVFLFVIFFYEEIWEFLVFLLSNWFMVSLLYNYKTKPRWLQRYNTAFRVAFRTIVWLRRSVTQHRKLSMNQLSVLNLRWPPMVPLFAAFTAMAVRTEVVPKKAKEGIMQYLVELGPHRTPANGKSALARHQHLAWACKSNSVAEVILTWHIATGILEVKGAAAAPAGVGVDSRKVATRLSNYCAYLVAFHRELLPGNPEKAERVFEDIKVGLKDMLGFWGYYLLPPQRRRAEKIMAWKPAAGTDAELTPGQKIVKDGVELANSLIAMERADGPAAPAAWKVLADVWTELVVYLAPSSDEERVKGHEDILVQGGEFITVLWALTTHIGVSRNATRTGAGAPTVVNLV